jgi:hypothetical protein
MPRDGSLILSDIHMPTLNIVCAACDLAAISINGAPISEHHTFRTVRRVMSFQFEVLHTRGKSPVHLVQMLC